MGNIWKPGAFQGRKKKKDYFEGWYYKTVSEDEKTAYAIIPGVSITDDPEKSHAFIMLMDARNQQLYYFQIPLTEFWADKDRFKIKIGNNTFSENSIHIDINDDENLVKADMKFNNIIPWPVKLFSPGVMSWYRFIPFMECYHAILSFNHSIEGYVNINGNIKNLSSGKGYMEKDWGSSMPSSWIWMQTNHFNIDGVSLFGSIAKIPWLRNYFTGYIFGFLYDGQLYKFTTYNGAKVKKLDVNKERISIIIEDKRYKLEIEADRTEGVDLPAPKMGEMKSRVNESLRSKIHIKLSSKKANKGEYIFSGTGKNAGLEFVGDINELLEGFKK